MPSSGTNSKWLAFSFLGAVILALAIWAAQRHRSEPIRKSALGQIATGSIQAISNQSVKLAAPPINGSDRGLRELCDALRMESSATFIRQKLNGWREKFAEMPKSAATTLVRQFLDSKADASTHLGFKLTSDGLLDDAPTLRVFLLDELGRIDPVAAADYSKVILASMDSPDEWAVALRNLAWGNSSVDGRTLLEQKTAQMLQYTPWQQNPSVGFLEAFDTAVYIGGTDLLPILSNLVREQDNLAVAHAASLAMDRLVINDPASTLGVLESDPSFMQGRESTRADYFARANVADLQQRQILEHYLLNPSISLAEKQTFADIYPNMNYMLSQNLLTQSTTLGHDALITRDEQALAVAEQWLTDPRFTDLNLQVRAIAQRLTGLAAESSQ